VLVINLWPSKVAQGYQTDAIALQVRCEGVADAMRRERNADVPEPSPGASDMISSEAAMSPELN
jgi:hypothetical protein